MSCPFCADSSDDQKIHWVLCDVCESWCHQSCVHVNNVLLIDQFHCPKCEITHGPSTFKEQRRPRRSSAAKLNYADLNEGTSTGDERIWGKLLRAKSFALDTFSRYKAQEINMDLIRKTGLRQPFIVETNEPELEMRMPPSDITVHQIAELVGGKDYPVDVIDVASQSELSGWTMGRWADYFHSTEKDRIRNVISLEITGSELAEQITRPKIVRELDWTEQMWRTDLHPDEFPRVQLYCLMSVKDSYTDFHIDFGGSSVFYHVLRGRKVFYLIEPTSKNLKKYQRWSSSPDQSTTFFADEVKSCYAVELQAGNTMIIPSGWIHAVFTPDDSIVIGGNFLHSFYVQAQADVYAIEDITQVPLKFRYPFYKRLNWYALETFSNWLTDENKRRDLSGYEMESMLALANFLRNQLNKSIENGTTTSNNTDNESLSASAAISKDVRKKEQIPVTISDPMALIHEVLDKVKKFSTGSAASIQSDNEADTIKDIHTKEPLVFDLTRKKAVMTPIIPPVEQRASSPMQTTIKNRLKKDIFEAAPSSAHTADQNDSRSRKRKASFITAVTSTNDSNHETFKKKTKKRKNIINRITDTDTSEQLSAKSELDNDKANTSVTTAVKS